jgi:hypothetical protein
MFDVSRFSITSVFDENPQIYKNTVTISIALTEGKVQHFILTKKDLFLKLLYTQQVKKTMIIQYLLKELWMKENHMK